MDISKSSSRSKPAVQSWVARLREFLLRRLDGSSTLPAFEERRDFAIPEVEKFVGSSDGLERAWTLIQQLYERSRPIGQHPCIFLDRKLGLEVREHLKQTDRIEFLSLFDRVCDFSLLKPLREYVASNPNFRRITVVIGRENDIELQPEQEIWYTEDLLGDPRDFDIEIADSVEQSSAPLSEVEQARLECGLWIGRSRRLLLIVAAEALIILALLIWDGWIRDRDSGTSAAELRNNVENDSEPDEDSSSGSAGINLGPRLPRDGGGSVASLNESEASRPDSARSVPPPLSSLAPGKDIRLLLPHNDVVKVENLEPLTTETAVDGAVLTLDDELITVEDASGAPMLVVPPLTFIPERRNDSTLDVLPFEGVKSGFVPLKISLNGSEPSRGDSPSFDAPSLGDAALDTPGASNADLEAPGSVAVGTDELLESKAHSTDLVDRSEAPEIVVDVPTSSELSEDASINVSKLPILPEQPTVTESEVIDEDESNNSENDPVEQPIESADGEDMPSVPEEGAEDENSNSAEPEESSEDDGNDDSDGGPDSSSDGDEPDGGGDGPGGGGNGSGGNPSDDGQNGDGANNEGGSENSPADIGDDDSIDLPGDSGDGDESVDPPVDSHSDGSIEPPVNDDGQGRTVDPPVDVDTPIGADGNEPHEQNADEQIIDASGGTKSIELPTNASGRWTVLNFGGIGSGAHPTAEILAEVDTLIFLDPNLDVQDLRLAQVGQDLKVTFASNDSLEVWLPDFKLDQFENLPQPKSSTDTFWNLRLGADDPGRDSFDVFNSDVQYSSLFNANSISFFNALDNFIYGLDDSDDQIHGQQGDDTLRGGSGNDVLLGGEGDDYLVGDAGDDKLIGGTGHNVAKGGSGADRYVVALNGYTFMPDFMLGEDVILLSTGMNSDDLTTEFLESGTKDSNFQPMTQLLYRGQAIGGFAGQVSLDQLTIHVEEHNL